jgi:hypothetical protein
MASSTIVTSLPKRADTPSGTLTGRTSRPKTRMGGCRTAIPLLQGGKIDVEMIYFYHLREGKVAEFWLQANGDFDYKAKP